MFSKISRALESFINDYRIPGNDLVVYHKGECIFREWRGYSDRERKTPMNGKERFNLYSSSKIITCTSAMKLYESGAFSLDDPLYLYMPEFRDMSVMTKSGAVRAKNHIRVRDLFTMTAGFDYSTSSPEIERAKTATGGRCPTRRVMEYLAERPLSFEPGTKWQYSLCHDVLAAFVETVSGQRFGEYVKKNIFDVAGMTRSTYMLPDEELPTLMAQYKYHDDKRIFEHVGPEIQPYKFGPDYESGGAGCISTVDDYIKFLEALRTGMIIKPETLLLMRTNQLTPEIEKTFIDSTPQHVGYGYGLGCWCSNGTPGCEDFGWTGAAGTTHYINPELDYSVFYCQHVIAAPNRPVFNPIRPILRKLLANG